MKSARSERVSRMSHCSHFHRTHLNFLTLLFCSALCLAMGEQGFAQTVQADQAELARTQGAAASAPNAFPGGVVDGHAAPSPNDSDLGEQEILEHAERYQAFTASVALP